MSRKTPVHRSTHIQQKKRTRNDNDTESNRFEPNKKRKCDDDDDANGDCLSPDPQSINWFDRLPEEMIEYILSFLDTGFETLIARQVCSKWLTIVPAITEDFSDEHYGILTTKRALEGVTEQFMVYHATRNHTSILSKYLGERHIDANLLKIMTSEVAPIECYNQKTLHWLHLSKNMRLTKRDLKAIVKGESLILLDWVYCYTSARVYHNEDDDNKAIRGCLMSSYETQKRLARNIVKYHSERLWDWLRDELENDFDKNILIIILRCALKHGFKPAIHQRITGSDEELLENSQNIFSCTRHGIESGHTDLLDHLYDHWLSKNAQPLGPGAIEDLWDEALRVNGCMQYIWMCKRFGDRMQNPQMMSLTDMIEKHGNKCHALLELLLDAWPGLVDLLNSRFSYNDIFDSSSLKRHLVRQGLYKILYVFHDRNCLLFTQQDVLCAINIVQIDHGRVAIPDRQRKTLEYLARAAGFTDPSTWNIRFASDVWR